MIYQLADGCPTYGCFIDRPYSFCQGALMGSHKLRYQRFPVCAPEIPLAWLARKLSRTGIGYGSGFFIEAKERPDIRNVFMLVERPCEHIWFYAGDLPSPSIVTEFTPLYLGLRKSDAWRAESFEQSFFAVYHEAHIVYSEIVSPVFQASHIVSVLDRLPTQHKQCELNINEVAVSLPDDVVRR